LIDADRKLPLFTAVKRLAIYTRDTTRIPASASSQEVDLRDLASKLEFQSVRVFRDAPARPSRTRESRKALVALTHAIRAGGIDVVAVLSLPVISGSPTALGKFLVQLRDAGVGLLVHHTDPQEACAAGDALLTAGSHLADLGVSERRRRTLEGQARAAAAGQHIGRPRVPPERVEKVRAALAGGAGIRAAARLAGVSPASVLRIARAATAHSNRASAA
jgi:DNA invertase Pin-like site-specific DNA recombinase